MWRLESLTLAIRSDGTVVSNGQPCSLWLIILGQGYRAGWMNDGPTLFVDLVTELNPLRLWEFRKGHQPLRHG